MRLSHRWGILAHSFLQNCFISAPLEGLQVWKDCLMSCHSISIRFKSGLWLSHSKILIMFFLSHSEMSVIIGVFWIIVLQHNPIAWVWGHKLTAWQNVTDILFHEFLLGCRIHGSINYGKSFSYWSCKAAPDHHTTTTMFDCWYDVLFIKCVAGFTPDGTGHAPSKKFNFCLISPQNMDSLGVILIGQPLLGRLTTFTSFLHLWIMALAVVRWSPIALEMAL